MLGGAESPPSDSAAAEDSCLFGAGWAAEASSCKVSRLLGEGEMTRQQSGSVSDQKSQVDNQELSKLLSVSPETPGFQNAQTSRRVSRERFSTTRDVRCQSAYSSNRRLAADPLCGLRRNFAYLWGILCAIFSEEIDRVRSGHEAMASGGTASDRLFKEIVFQGTEPAAIDGNGDIMHDLGQNMTTSDL